jgi:hypothetical protein
MATKQELKAEIVVLRKRVDELAARVAALEGRVWVLPVKVPDEPEPYRVTWTDTDSTSAMPRVTWVRA